eukprot:TRINITY_DN10205_c0_g1_i1.p1 TRINITY_DN10205_c0_g1~~TRINITY_DN10205_c0_g1_i1.p1  ORF type:complete len:1025 (-),score=456.25 TRINITY_DN10205_c0_g1_i1:51-2990(-)
MSRRRVVEEEEKDEEGEILDEEEDDDDDLDEEDEDELDEDEEDEDEDEEDGGRRRKKPKRKRHRAETFIDAEAYEDSASSEEEDGPDGETDDFIDQTGEVDTSKSVRRFHTRLARRDDDLDFEYRYASIPEEDQSSQLTQRALLPSTRDPRMWIIRCRIGSERKCVLEILRRMLERKNNGRKFNILSAVASDHVPGFVYIESERETHIREALEGLTTVIGINRPKLVPINEMTDVMKIKRTKELPKIGTFARVKRGLYKGDLVKIIEINPDETKALLQIIPRLDFQEMERKNNANRDDPDAPMGGRGKRGRVESEVDNSKPRPEPKLYHADKYDYNFELKGHKFVNGFLQKYMPLTSIDFKNVVPLPAELQKFSVDQEAFTALLKSTQPKKQIKFVVGDTVRVTTGDIMNLTGVIHQINNDTVIIRSSYDGLKGELLSVQRDHLAKVFSVGTPVKVIDGKFKGSTGIVASSNRTDNTVAVCAPGSRNTITVLADDLEMTTSISKDEVQLGDYRIHDLVQTYNKTVGVIVRIDSEYLYLLEVTGVVGKYQLPKIETKVSSTASRDYNGKSLDAECPADVHFGLHAGKSGTVKHTFNRCVFIHCPQVSENGGIILVQNNDCSRKDNPRHFGGNRPDRPGGFPNSPGGDRGGFNRGPGGPPGGGGPPRIITKEKVRIESGNYRGYRGTIMNVRKAGRQGGPTEDMCTIRLEVNNETITIPLSFVREPHRPGSSASSSSSSDYSPYGQSRPSGGRQGGYGVTNSYQSGFDSVDYNRGSQTPARAPDSPDKNHSAFDPSSPYPEPRSSSFSNPYTPQSVNPHTPNYARTPNEAYTEQQYDYVRSPMTAPTPLTPGMVPRTPAAYPYVPERTESFENALVQMNDSYSGGMYKGQMAVVRSTTSVGYYKVELENSSTILQVPFAAFEPIMPGARDLAKVVRPPYGQDEQLLGRVVMVINQHGDEFVIDYNGRQTAIKGYYLAKYKQ